MYTFANITLLGRVIFFADVFGDYSGPIYLLFSSLSNFTFLVTGLVYLINIILELLYRYEESVSNRPKKRGMCRKSLVFLGIAILVIYVVEYLVQICTNPDKINQLNRVTLVVLYSVVGSIFLVLTIQLFRFMFKSEDEAVTYTRRKVSILFVCLSYCSKY